MKWRRPKTAAASASKKKKILQTQQYWNNLPLTKPILQRRTANFQNGYTNTCCSGSTFWIGQVRETLSICEKIKKWLSFPAVIDFLFIFLNSIWLQNRWWCYWSWRIRICTIRIWSQRTHGKTGIYNFYTGRPKHLHIKISSVTKISWFLYPYSHPYCVLILWVFLGLTVPALAPSRL